MIRADSQARGYWNRPEETAQTFRPDGVWSGDLGYLDDEGYLHIAGRKTDMIISGGFNVYPAEIERVIGPHPQVDMVAVVGLPHPEWGETPVAVVVPRATSTPRRSKPSCARCAAPSSPVTSSRAGSSSAPRFPLGPAGKILKREVKASLADGPGQAS